MERSLIVLGLVAMTTDQYERMMVLIEGRQQAHVPVASACCLTEISPERMLDFFPDVMFSGGLDDTRFFDHSSSIERDAMNTTMRWLTMTFLGQDIHNRKIQDLDNFNAISIALAIAVKDALGLLGYNRFKFARISRTPCSARRLVFELKRTRRRPHAPSLMILVAMAMVVMTVQQWVFSWH
jgi:hypothetical protein